MKTKEGVNLFGLKLAMRKVLIHAERIWREYGQELVVTSTVDGVHSPGSLHPYGYAVDLRTNYFKAYMVSEIVEELKESLGSEYFVLYHPTHIHVEYKAILKIINDEMSKSKQR